MTNIDDALAGLELAQIGWVVPDINTAVKFLGGALGIAGFHEPEPFRAHDWQMTYYGKAVPGEWLITQSIFHDYLAQYPAGGVQHLAFQLPVSNFDQLTTGLRGQGYKTISELDHPIARIAFFDTYENMGVATEIIGIKPYGRAAVKP